MNNLYVVISEELSVVVPVTDDGQGPLESYRIAELVIAKNRAKAGLAAWKTDKNSYELDITERPKMSIRLLAKGLGYPCGTIVSNWLRFDHYWGHKQVYAADQAAR